MTLLLILLFPFIGILIILFCPLLSQLLVKKISLFFSILTFYTSLFLWIFFEKSSLFFQYLLYQEWFSFLNINLIFGVDGLSLFFILLTTFLIPICILSSWKNILSNVKLFFILFLFLEIFLLIIFSILDLFLFYIFFESVLIPMFLIIGIWGSRERKIKASYFFFIYTLFGSLVMLLGILLVLFDTGTTSFFTLISHNFSNERQLLLWLMFFMSFSIKIPIIPFHIWLPEAHVEAPTIGSVILAGVLLKLGIYGLLRFSFVLFPYANTYFTPFIYTISIISIIYSSLTTIRQVDLKRIVAYSSVAHMNFSLLGLFSNTIQGFTGGLLLSISHGFIASALFLCIGILYDRYHTRLVKYYSGLALVMPLFSLFFLFFSLSNLGLPGTSSFVGELLILLGSFNQNYISSILGTSGILFGTLYSIWLYNRICFGNLKIQYNAIYIDISKREFFILLPLVFATLVMGFCPTLFLDYLYSSSYFFI
uniref:NADH-ubiquinone oxidoreductase chain 4 n=1 Tax=Spongospora subterranea TaxID=70186 RepID=A0A096XTV5_9EUKA|nr:NADH dehydrogenase subunit 4 [Spongospora subterranea]AIK19923.1 NADH dehydrogenase subunit 4 [Spongospora subterranea]